MINKKEGQRWYQALAKGAIQGSLGGVLIYGGKRLVYPINQKQNFMYGWPAKLVHTTGASILENAAGNRNFWESWSLHLGFIRLHLQTRSPHINVRILPYSINGLIVAFRYGKLDLKTSLQLGTLYLKRDSSFTIPGRNYSSTGASFVNSMVVIEKFPFYNRWYNKYSIAAHEYVHEFKHREFFFSQ